jgi:GGDEF domain-containing protein
MSHDPFLDEDSSVLTPEAFEFVLTNELKRAVRSQNFLTLLVIDTAPRIATTERAQVARQMARLISCEVRETDLLTCTEEGRLSVVLLDADLENSMRVIDRLMSRVEHYEFTTPTAVSIGAASCPMHGTDAETLRRAASSRLVHTGREARGNASNAQ